MQLARNLKFKQTLARNLFKGKNTYKGGLWRGEVRKHENDTSFNTHTMYLQHFGVIK